MPENAGVNTTEPIKPPVFSANDRRPSTATGYSFSNGIQQRTTTTTVEWEKGGLSLHLIVPLFAGRMGWTSEKSGNFGNCVSAFAMHLQPADSLPWTTGPVLCHSFEQGLAAAGE